MGGSSQMQAPEPTGQLGQFSSLGQDPTNSMRMGGNMLTSTPPTGAGTMQPLVGTMGQSSGIGPSTGAGGNMVIGSAPGPGQTAPQPTSPFSSLGGSLFGGNQLQEFIAKLLQEGDRA